MLQAPNIFNHVEEIVMFYWTYEFEVILKDTYIYALDTQILKVV